MWVLDPANRRELLDRLRPHSTSPDFDVIWCGEGWSALVGGCHEELLATFPDYRFSTITQQGGAPLPFLSARPSARRRAGRPGPVPHSAQASSNSAGLSVAS